MSVRFHRFEKFFQVSCDFITLPRFRSVSDHPEADSAHLSAISAISSDVVAVKEHETFRFLPGPSDIVRSVCLVVETSVGEENIVYAAGRNFERARAAAIFFETVSAFVRLVGALDKLVASSAAE